MSLFKSTKNTRAILPNSFRYIRSDVPASLSPEERQWLLDNNVRTIVDLRQKCEQLQKPCTLQNDKGFDYDTFPITGGNAVPESPDDVVRSYVSMLDDVLSAAVDHIMSAESNVLFFCSAGKDRTGVVSAVILSKLGYPEQYIVDDYLLSASQLKDDLVAFAKKYPSTDINVITPRAQYIIGFLEYLRRVGQV